MAAPNAATASSTMRCTSDGSSGIGSVSSKTQTPASGISIKDLTPAVAGSESPTFTEGAVIAQVGPGSSAEQGGIQKGDIVVAANGSPIRSAAQLRNKIGLTTVGDRLRLTVERKGVAHHVSVQVAPANDTAGTRASTAAGLSRPSARERRAGSWN